MEKAHRRSHELVVGSGFPTWEPWREQGEPPYRGVSADLLQAEYVIPLAPGTSHPAGDDKIDDLRCTIVLGRIGRKPLVRRAQKHP